MAAADFNRMVSTPMVSGSNFAAYQNQVTPGRRGFQQTQAPMFSPGFQRLLGMGAWQQAVQQGVPQGQARPTSGDQLSQIAMQDFRNEESLQNYRNQVTGQQVAGIQEMRSGQAAQLRGRGQELYDLQTAQGQQLQGDADRQMSDVVSRIDANQGKFEDWANRSADTMRQASQRAEQEYKKYEAEGADLMSATAYGMARDAQDSVKQMAMQMRASGATESEIAQATQTMRMDSARNIQANIGPMQEQLNQYKAQMGMQVANMLGTEAGLLSNIAGMASQQGAQAIRQLMGSQQQRNQLVQAGMGMQQAAVQQMAVNELQATQYELQGLNESAELARMGFNFVSALDTAVTSAQLREAYGDTGYYNYGRVERGQSPWERFDQGLNTTGANRQLQVHRPQDFRMASSGISAI